MANARKNVIVSLDIEELSLVDKGAQEPGHEPVLKRDRSGAGQPLGKKVKMTAEADGHQHVYEAGLDSGTTSYNSGTGGYGHSHPYVVEDGVVKIGAANGHTHEPIGKAAKKPKPKMPMSDDDVEDVGDDMEDEYAEGGGKKKPKPVKKSQETPMTTDADKIKQLEDDNARLRKLAKLPDAQRAHYDALPEEDRPVFLTKSAHDRAAEVAALDEVVYTADDGTRLTKRHDPLLVKYAKMADENAREARRSKVAKRASEIFKHSKGTPDVHAAIVSAFEIGIADEAIRKAAFEVLAAGDAAVGRAFTDLPAGPGLRLVDGEPAEGEAAMAKMAAERSAATGDSINKSRAHLMEHSAEYRAANERAKAQRRAGSRG